MITFTNTKKALTDRIAVTVDLNELKARYTDANTYEMRYDTFKILQSGKCKYQFELSNMPYFCGGVLLSNMWYSRSDGDPEIIKQNEGNLKEALNVTFQYLYEFNHGLVNYITVPSQEEIISILEHFAFKPVISVYNPNSGNICTQWTLDLNEYCKNVEEN